MLYKQQIFKKFYNIIFNLSAAAASALIHEALLVNTEAHTPKKNRSSAHAATTMVATYIKKLERPQFPPVAQQKVAAYMYMYSGNLIKTVRSCQR